MLRILFATLGLLVGATAMAAEAPRDDDGLAWAQDGPLAGAQDKPDERKSKNEEKAAAQQAALDDIGAGKKARVVVLKWMGSDAGHENESLKNNVKSRISRPDAKFFSEIDLYQAGRKMPGNKRPYEQLGAVPQQNVDAIYRAIAEVETIPWNGLSESDWGIKALDLRELIDLIWFVDRPEVREPLFLLYMQIGRAAENQNNPVAPFYEFIGGLNVNYYWYLAASLAYQEPGLLSKITDPDLNASIGYLKGMLDSGQIPLMTLAFEMEDKWDAADFADEYTVYINGLETAIESKDSLYKVPPGRVDVYFERSDGHSLSDRIELDKLDDKIYFVRDTARKKMGKDFIDQLMKHPNECTPELDGEIVNYLAIYADLHKDEEVYVAVAPAGVVSKTMLWRYDRNTASLQKVLDLTGGFPVRFAAILGTGMHFNGAALPDPNQYYEDLKASGAECMVDDDPSDCPPPEAPTLEPSSVPIILQLRGHYNRLMVVAGLDLIANITGDPWIDNYQTGDGHSVVDGTGAEALKEASFSRLTYIGAGVVLGTEASAGIGPRGWVRTGWYHVPHTIDATMHLGITTEAPGGMGSGRTKVLLDAEAFGGAMIPLGDSQFDKAILTFGLQAGAGITF